MNGNLPDHGQVFDADLASLDFADILGGPMSAAIGAQAQAAMVSLNFIEQVGLKAAGNGTFTTPSVTFSYTKNVPTANGTTPQVANLTVPLLSLVPVPFIRVQQLSIDLNVKLNSVERANASSNLATHSNLSSNENSLFNYFSPVKFSTTITTKNDSASGSSEKERYNLGVKMLAVQDEMPAGLARVLAILEASISGTGKGNGT